MSAPALSCATGAIVRSVIVRSLDFSMMALLAGPLGVR
jgi:hypothetical protein